MKIVLSTLNAKYIHTSLALRWLYVANKDRFDISYIEFVIKEDLDYVAQKLVETGCDILGLSIYIWNVKQMELLIKKIKQLNPAIIIFIGGPEVMYEAEYFVNHWEADYLISGEGEFVTGELFTALKQGEKDVNIPGVSYKGHISNTIVQADISKLIELDSPYQLPEDQEALKHRVIYFETSRGCPYQCQYCLSSLERGVRYFPQEYIFDNLKYFIDSDAKLIKFLDRTFNLNMKHTYGIFNFLIAHYRPSLSCQFEIYADLLKDEMIEFLNTKLPNNFFRFEIGIQSTYEPTNLEVKRRQDFQLLASNIQKLMKGGKIDLHLDLIAGLPFETYDRFVKSFNDVFDLGAKEVQLGFLKLLRGTNLRKNADNYGYEYQDNAPYEIFRNHHINEEEIERIHDAEDMLDKFWNSGRFNRSMTKVLFEHYRHRYFEFFDELAHHFKRVNFPRFGYQLEDLFRELERFLELRNIDVFKLLRDDYYDNYNLRPHGFWREHLSKKEKKQLMNRVTMDNEYLRHHNLTKKKVEDYALIDPIDEQQAVITIFNERKSKEVPHPRLIYTFSK